MKRIPSTWNYVIVKEGEMFRVHEQYITHKGKIGSITTNPVAITAESEFYLWKMITDIIVDCRNFPILEYKNGKLKKYVKKR